MSHFLVFQLQGPMAAWGEPAVGEFRGSADAPGTSAIVGLLGAALGVRRDDEVAHHALAKGYGFAVGVQDGGQLLRDFHTAQVSPRSAMKGRPHNTRRDELGVPRHDLSTMLSTRDYRQGGAWLVALQPRSSTPPHPLSALQQALARPRFTLYLGRKACPPAAPLWPQVLDTESAHAAFALYLQRQREAHEQANLPRRFALPTPSALRRMTFDAHIEAGVAATMRVTRKDRLLRRGAWQFGDRDDFIALLTEE